MSKVREAMHHQPKLLEAIHHQPWHSLAIPGQPSQTSPEVLDLGILDAWQLAGSALLMAHMSLLLLWQPKKNIVCVKLI